MVSPAIVIATLLTLMPFVSAAFFSRKLLATTETLPEWLQRLAPAALSVPYLLVACSAGIFRWGWFAVYALLPIAVSWLLCQARRIDSGQRGNWRDFLVLAALGLAVDLRWLERT